MSTRRSATRGTKARAEVVEIDRARRPAPLGPGAHFARLGRKLDAERFEATVLGRANLVVRLAPEVDEALADACLAGGDVVLVGEVDGEILMYGALRTKAARLEEVVVDAPKKLVLRAGKSKLELRADGRVRLSADHVTVDAPHEVRLASARVEIP